MRCRKARRLLIVVGFDDLNIVIRHKQMGGFVGHLCQEANSQRHVGGFENRSDLDKLSKIGLQIRRKSGRANYGRAPVLTNQLKQNRSAEGLEKSMTTSKSTVQANRLVIDRVGNIGVGNQVGTRHHHQVVALRYDLTNDLTHSPLASVKKISDWHLCCPFWDGKIGRSGKKIQIGERSADDVEIFFAGVAQRQTTLSDSHAHQV